METTTDCGRERMPGRAGKATHSVASLAAVVSLRSPMNDVLSLASAKLGGGGGAELSAGGGDRRQGVEEEAARGIMGGGSMNDSLSG